MARRTLYSMPLRLSVFPSTDLALASAAETCLQNGATTPVKLAACLQALYPSVNVRAGVDNGLERRWYVYREGHWFSG